MSWGKMTFGEKCRSQGYYGKKWGKMSQGKMSWGKMSLGKIVLHPVQCVSEKISRAQIRIKDISEAIVRNQM